MPDITQKQAAALAGVMMYMQREHAELNRMVSTYTPGNRINPWAFYGRKTTSQVRRLIQGRRMHHAHMHLDAYPQNRIPVLQRAAYLTANRCRTSLLVRKKRSSGDTDSHFTKETV